MMEKKKGFRIQVYITEPELVNALIAHKRTYESKNFVHVSWSTLVKSLLYELVSKKQIRGDV
jgi:hypothetical protein